MRRLAEQAGSSAQEIRQLIGEIRNSVEQVVTAMEHTQGEVQQGYARSTEAETALTAILESVSSVGRKCKASHIPRTGLRNRAAGLASILETRNTSEQNAHNAREMARSS